MNREPSGTMVDDVCGEALRPTFEDVECGSGPVYPSDNACSSVEDDNISNDDEVEELYADPDPPARVRVWDVERVEIVIDPSPLVTTRVQDSRCTAGNMCDKKTAPLIIEGRVCLNSHNVDGCLWAERGDACRVTLEDLSEYGRTHTAIVGVLIYFGCIGI